MGGRRLRAVGPSELPAARAFLHPVGSRPRSRRRGRAALPVPPSFSPPRGATPARGDLQATGPRRPSPLGVSRTPLPERPRHSLIGGCGSARGKKPSSDWPNRLRTGVRRGVARPRRGLRPRGRKERAVGLVPLNRWEPRGLGQTSPLWRSDPASPFRQASGRGSDALRPSKC